MASLSHDIVNDLGVSTHNESVQGSTSWHDANEIILKVNKQVVSLSLGFAIDCGKSSCFSQI